jgi:hypothetical protein
MLAEGRTDTVFSTACPAFEEIHLIFRAWSIERFDEITNASAAIVRVLSRGRVSLQELRELEATIKTDYVAKQCQDETNVPASVTLSRVDHALREVEMRAMFKDFLCSIPAIAKTKTCQEISTKESSRRSGELLHKNSSGDVTDVRFKHTNTYPQPIRKNLASAETRYPKIGTFDAVTTTKVS